MLILLATWVRTHQPLEPKTIEVLEIAEEFSDQTEEEVERENWFPESLEPKDLEMIRTLMIGCSYIRKPYLLIKKSKVMKFHYPDTKIMVAFR